MTAALKDSGVIYTSFKYGEFEGERNGRYFTDFTIEAFKEYLQNIPELQIEEYWITGDVRPGRGEEKSDFAKVGYSLTIDGKYYNTLDIESFSLMMKDPSYCYKLPTMSDEEQYALLATDGMLVKRPMMVGDDFVLVGFKEADWEDKLK